MKNLLDKHITIYEGNNLYDFDNNIMLNWYPYRIIEFSGDSKSILELGIGHGFTVEIFSRYFKRHLVLEGSNLVIENFKKHYPQCNSEIVETYFEKFESDEKFDVIVLGFILEHINDPQEILKQFSTFLSETGKIYVAVPNAEALNRRIGNYAGLLPHIQMLSENDKMLGHKRYYTVNTLSKEIIKAGYEIEKIEGIYLKPVTTQQMISLNFDKKMIEAFCNVGIKYPELCCGILAELKKII